MSVIRPSATSRTSSANRQGCRRGRKVGTALRPTSRWPRYQARAFARLPGGKHGLADLEPATQPRDERRHGERRALESSETSVRRRSVRRRPSNARAVRSVTGSSAALPWRWPSLTGVPSERAQLADATDVSSNCATSSADQHRTSRRISTARWRGGRYCSAATNARRIVSRCTAKLGGDTICSPQSDLCRPHF